MKEITEPKIFKPARPAFRAGVEAGVLQAISGGRGGKRARKLDPMRVTEALMRQQGYAPDLVALPFGRAAEKRLRKAQALVRHERLFERKLGRKA